MAQVDYVAGDVIICIDSFSHGPFPSYWEDPPRWPKQGDIFRCRDVRPSWCIIHRENHLMTELEELVGWFFAAGAFRKLPKATAWKEHWKKHSAKDGQGGQKKRELEDV